MSNKLPRVTADKVIKAVQKLGFQEVRSKGSHKIFKNTDKTKRVVIPYHSGKNLHPKIIKDILKATNITLEEFIKLL